MVIDIILTYYQGRGEVEELISMTSKDLIKKGHEVRIFQFFKPVYQEWIDTLPNLYYYGIENQSEQKMEYLTKCYSEQIKKLGMPDAILTTYCELLYVFNNTIGMLEENKPPSILWAIDNKINIYQDNILKNYDAFLTPDKLMKNKISTYLNNYSDVYYTGTDLVESSNIIENTLDKYICLNFYKYKINKSIKNNELETALSLIKAYINKFGSPPKICELEGDILIKYNKLDDAYNVIKHGIENDSLNINLLGKMGYIMFKKANYLESIKYYHKALENDNNIESINTIKLNLKELFRILPINITSDFIKNYDDVVGNINFTSDIYDDFIYKKSQVYENNYEIDKALRGYKTIVLNTENEDIKRNSLEKIYNIHLNKKYLLEENSNCFINLKLNNYKNSQEDLISVCIASYKNLEYLMDCINSLLIQTYPNIEVIIFDDKSDDFYVDKYRDYILKNNNGNISRLIIYNNKMNLGSVCSFNKAISISSGKYIKIISADDMFYNKDVIQDMYDTLSKSDYKVLTTNMEYCDENMNKLSWAERSLQVYRQSMPYVVYPELFLEMSIKGNIIPAPGVMFKREVFEEYGLFDEKYYILEDYPYWLKLLFNNCPIDYKDMICAKYRYGVGVSTSANKNKYLVEDMKKSEVSVATYKSMLNKRNFDKNAVVNNICKVSYGDNIHLNIKTIFNGEGKVNIGNNVSFGVNLAPHFYGCHNMIQARFSYANIYIGDDTVLSNDITIISASNITIGKGCLIGDRVTIIDHDTHGISLENRRGSCGEIKPITIKDNVWIGSSVFILKGVTIGENSIIGAGSVVTKDVDDNTIVGGNPARFIKRIN